MQTVKNVTERLAGTAANGYHQSDVSDLQGKTALVTGGTGGIGFEVAKAFALANAKVFLLSRKEENGDSAVAKIQEASSRADITFVQCDLGNLAQVRSVADTLAKQEDRLDLVICGAGVGVNAYAESSDGIDRHVAVNHLGHMLLVNRLLPLLRKTSRLPNTSAPRIVSISSELHRAAPSATSFASIDELNDSSLSAVALYGRSKLANILFTKYGLEDRVLRPNNDNIIALATHPGAVHTGQQDQFKEAYGQVFGTVMKYSVIPFMREPDQGSLSTLWAATSDSIDGDLVGYQGKYFTDPAVVGDESKQACDPELGQRLWKLSEELIKHKAGMDALLPWVEEKGV
ncbi:NAD-binding protein [Cytidiella melzeri]|nr:NAD-binding protein [Cytidiella melzeri]